MRATDNSVVLGTKEMTLRDHFGRTFKTLRVSVTDRCDLRCRYCMPKEGLSWIPSENLLTFEERIRLIRLLVRLGMERIKITGGEPLLDPRLPELVENLAHLPLKDLSLTTNGTHLESMAVPLQKAGLKRVTVSLDSLDGERFQSMTRGGSLKKVWRGLLAAEDAGLNPLKINCVVLRENEEDLIPLARLTYSHPWEIRLIEYMPVTKAVGLARSESIPPQEIKQLFEKTFGTLEPIAGYPHAPASSYRLPWALGKIGFISSVSESFCSRCDRLRLSADGFLKLCMAHSDGLALRPLLRAGLSDEELTGHILKAVDRKPEGHAFWFKSPEPEEAMSRIGG